MFQMTIWQISGAFSRIGKTSLAKKLEENLPNAVLVKIGHGRRKNDIQNNFFSNLDQGIDFIREQKGKSEHCIVESNRRVGSLKSDLVIYLDSVDGERRRDAEKLRGSAEIVLGHRGNPSEWKTILGRLELPVGVRSRVLDTLREQHEFICGNRLALRTKIWFSHNGKVVFGEGLARLLHGIDSLGSLSAAAKAEDISYRHAWGDLKRAEERLGFPLLDRSTGGRAGGGSVLTNKARKVLEGYETLKLKTVRESDKWFRKLMEDIKLDKY